MTSQRGRFGGHPFHQVAIADQAVGVVVNEWVIRPIKVRGQEALSNRQAYPVGKALAKWPAGCFHPWRQPPFGVTWSATAPLPEACEFIQRQIIPCQVQQAVEQHGAMSS